MYEQIDGVKVFYEIRGEKGLPVVLLHGWGCSSALMNPVAEALGQDHRVLVIDFPGFGQSQVPHSAWGVPEYAACLKKLLEQLKWIPCAVVGHSFGCRVAAWAAAEWPEIFTQMVFTGAAGLKKPVSEEARKKTAEFQRKKKIALQIERIPGFKTLGKTLEDKLRKKYGSADYNALNEDMRQTFVRVVNLDLRDRYALIRSSVLLIWGDADTETPLWMGREMEKLIPDAGLVIFEGGSHFAYLEQKERFNLIVRHFLTEGSNGGDK